MKIIRYQTATGNIAFAEQHPDGTATELVGELFGGFAATDRPATIAKLLAPLDPRALLCVGLNYRQHAAETNAELPKYPVLFFKNPGSVQNPGDPIVIPRWLRSEKVDFECELAVVIGKPCRNVLRKEALEYVLGYTCGNDVSARDWQKEGGGTQWGRGKSFDTFAPLGPCLVTPDELPNPGALRIRTMVSGETLQDCTTSDMVFDVPTLIEFLSGSTTLLPGTVILTGTPHGVGMARQPPRFLKAGETVTVEIEGIGALTNPVTEEQVTSGAPWHL
ncbi:MAG TPA: fumarylacetoacetate hydrolase family protein [Chthoniobacteraceae bacterium]|jgi:2-keto-4-pentenoate hydratase/2-oxohepta-3-ene-1,7-dioic acid hydratase in catechol pathway